MIPTSPLEYARTGKYPQGKVRLKMLFRKPKTANTQQACFESFTGEEKLEKQGYSTGCKTKTGRKMEICQKIG